MSSMSAGETSTKKVTSKEVEKWCKTDPVQVLLQSQTEIARFLELGYLGLRDFPELSAEIRITANNARTQHLLTAGLFKKFVVTANCVVETYCPMMKDAVELQDVDIVKEAFGDVLEMCLDMKKETESARDSYLKIGDKVQKDFINVNEKKTNVTKEQEKIKAEKEIDEEFKKEAEKQEEDLQQQKKELDNQIKKLTEDRADWLNKSEITSGADCPDFTETSHTVIDHSFIPSATIFGGALGFVAGPVGAAAGSALGYAAGTFLDAVTGSGMKTIKETKTARVSVEKLKEKVEISQQARESSKQAQEHIDKNNEEKRKIEEQIWQRKKETLEKLAHIKALDLQKKNVGDVSSLREAISQLGNVDKQFTKIIMFWDSMATMLKMMHAEQKAGGIFLKKIEDERYASKFLLSIEKAEKYWNNVGIMCSNYATVSDAVILSVYGFLSNQIDNYTEEQVQARKKDLEKEIIDELEQLAIE